MTDGYQAVIYDLDGTLTHLQVDWGQVREDVAAKFRVRDIDVADASLWELLERAEARRDEDAGLDQLARAVEETIAEHERDGARRSDRLPAADELPLDVPVGVCSLNCEAACRIALELHGIDSDVQVIVGRDTVERYKPDPEPLLYAARQLGAEPTQTLFVGDSERDEIAAGRAGMPFQYVSDRPE